MTTVTNESHITAPSNEHVVVGFNLEDPRVAAAIRSFNCHGASTDGNDNYESTVHPSVFVKNIEDRKKLYKELTEDLTNKVSRTAVPTCS